MKTSTVMVIGICAVAAGISFLATLAAAPKDPATTQASPTLNISTQDWSRARALDPTFPSESAAMSDALAKDRAQLADLLDNSTASDEAILAQVEKVIASHDQMERRAAQHLLKIRHQLSADQQKQLMGLASETVRQGGMRWRGGRGPSTAPSTQESNRPGRRRQGRGS